MYLRAVKLLGLDVDEVMMVAAHEPDLDASRAVGLATGYVHRPTEWGPDPAIGPKKPDPAAYDIVADDVLDLAAQLDASPLTATTCSTDP